MFIGVKKQIFLSLTNDHDYICNTEWEQLNSQKLFFRKNIAYYYTDLNAYYAYYTEYAHYAYYA